MIFLLSLSLLSSLTSVDDWYQQSRITAFVDAVPHATAKGSGTFGSKITRRHLRKQSKTALRAVLRLSTGT